MAQIQRSTYCRQSSRCCGDKSIYIIVVHWCAVIEAPGVYKYNLKMHICVLKFHNVFIQQYRLNQQKSSSWTFIIVAVRYYR
jgi:hypothetical protein